MGGHLAMANEALLRQEIVKSQGMNEVKGSAKPFPLSCLDRRISKIKGHTGGTKLASPSRNTNIIYINGGQ